MFLLCTVCDLFYSLTACALRVLWLVLTGVPVPPAAFTRRGECLRKAAFCASREILCCDRSKSAGEYAGCRSDIDHGPTHDG